jgi:ribosome-associated heat shock protein Hsp15
MDSRARADKWLWAVRLFPTRKAAADACAAGKVKRRGHALKAASTLQPGDEIELPFPGGPGLRRVRVVSPIERRVAAAEARLCHDDLTPMEVHAEQRAWHEARRDAPMGRPTKKHRREIDRFRGFFQ